MKKRVLPIIFTVLIGICILGNYFLNALAEDHAKPENNRYFTSIEIQKGDTLWSIARIYSQGGNLNLEDYLKELKIMNNLKEDVIQAGCYLTIMYFR